MKYITIEVKSIIISLSVIGQCRGKKYSIKKYEIFAGSHKNKQILLTL